MQAVDGSGLSRRNAVSPHEVGKLLVDDGARPRERPGLPRLAAGRRPRGHGRPTAWRARAAEGNCATKTGTLDGVSALSGYCNAGGHTIAFSILMNDVSIDAAHHAQDEIAAAIARYQP